MRFAAAFCCMDWGCLACDACAQRRLSKFSLSPKSEIRVLATTSCVSARLISRGSTSLPRFCHRRALCGLRGEFLVSFSVLFSSPSCASMSSSAGAPDGFRPPMHLRSLGVMADSSALLSTALLGSNSLAVMLRTGHCPLQVRTEEGEQVGVQAPLLALLPASNTGSQLSYPSSARLPLFFPFITANNNRLIRTSEHEVAMQTEDGGTHAPTPLSTALTVAAERFLISIPDEGWVASAKPADKPLARPSSPQCTCDRESAEAAIVCLAGASVCQGLTLSWEPSDAPGSPMQRRVYR